MKVPLSWLKEYVPLPASVPELVNRLTLAGLEVGCVRLFGLPVPDGLKTKQEEPGPLWARDKLFVAQVLEVTKHPDPKVTKLKLVQLDYGAGQPKQVVTAAPNLSVGDKGQKVVLGLTGTSYYDGHVTPKQLKNLEPGVLKGVPSDSMVMSTFELGIDEEHEGIIILEDDAPVGTPLADFMGDAVLEIDVLPNMARCLALLGVAREVAAITGQTVKLPALEIPFAKEAVEGKARVVIADPKLCARYAAMLIRDVKIGPAPGWMQRRLTYAGMRPINNIVDITNFVMLECGQPLHAFDYDVLVRRAGGKAPTITVRPAKPGEKLKTLDGVERELTPETLLITDDAGPIALAGVMGGAETEVSAKTTTVLLESANFDFVSIRRTSRAFNLFSEASTRFSRGIHPEVVKLGALRAAQLMQRHAGGTVLQGMVDSYPAPRPAQVISLKKSEVRRLLGIEMAAADVERILKALEFKVEADGADGWKVTAPPFRVDIQAGAADLIEELARVHGYDRLPATLLSGELPQQRGNREIDLEERVRDALAEAGLQEVRTYSLTAREREARFVLSSDDLTAWEKLQSDQAGDAAKQRAELLSKTPYVEVLNEISAERKVMRRSLLSSVLEVVETNLRITDTVRVFEAGLVYLPKAGQQLPDEVRRLVIAMTGRRSPASWDDPQGQKPATVDFFDLKGVAETLAAQLHLPAVTYRAVRDVPYLHPGRAAEMLVNGKGVGVFGELHPKTTAALKLGERAVIVADLDLEAILAAVPERFAYTPISPFPAALRDVAMLVDESVTHEQVVAEIRKAGGELLRHVRLFDLYRGDPIPEGKKNLAYALTYQAPDRTLKEGEIGKAHKQVEDRLRSAFKAQIRGQD